MVMVMVMVVVVMRRLSLTILGMMAMVTVMLIIMACLMLFYDECPQEHLMGGDCLNVGRVPSKALIRRAARAVHEVRHAAEFGISFRDVRVDFGTVGQLSTVPQLHCEASNACDLLASKFNGTFPPSPISVCNIATTRPFCTPPLGAGLAIIAAPVHQAEGREGHRPNAIM